MTISYTRSGTATFNRDDALRLGSQVVTDLYQLKKFYGKPSEEWIDKYLNELCVFLVHQALDYVEYGFQRGGAWVKGASLRYDVVAASRIGSGGTPGGIVAGIDVQNASWGSYLVTNDAYSNYSAERRQQIYEQLPFHRVGAPPPGTGGLTWVNDRNYYRNGVEMNRKVLG